MDSSFNRFEDDTRGQTEARPPPHYKYLTQKSIESVGLYILDVIRQAADTWQWQTYRFASVASAVVAWAMVCGNLTH